MWSRSVVMGRPGKGPDAGYVRGRDRVSRGPVLRCWEGEVRAGLRSVTLGSLGGPAALRHLD